MIARVIWISLIFSLSGCASVTRSSADLPAYRPCLQDPSRQAARSAELQQIVAADQGERKDFLHMTSDELMAMAKRDGERRQRVGQIFGEGCLKSAADYAAAALVYQHGDVPDHYMQTFLWAKRAVDLGDESQKSLMALGVDRYLVNVGRRQLFASQANRADTNDPKSCYCLQQVEHSFPDSLRKKYADRTLKDALVWLKTLNEGKSCANSECAESLAPSPKGSVPGFW